MAVALDPDTLLTSILPSEFFALKTLIAVTSSIIALIDLR